jgi:hypothetical protein
MADNYEKVEFAAEQPAEDQDHVQKMVELADKAAEDPNQNMATDNVEVSPKPDWVPEKFYNSDTGEINYEGLAKSYTELEKKQSAPKEETKEETKTAEPATAEEAVESAGLDMAALQSEYDEKGTLDDKSYEALEKAGIPKDTVNMYIEGQKALVAQAQAEAYQITEGADGYAAMSDWAKSNLSADDLKSYNTAVNSSNQSTREIAIRGLWGKYSADSGSGKDLIHGKASDSKVGGYKSRQQMIDAMKDPRYLNDPAYRAEVEAKVVAASF